MYTVAGIYRFPMSVLPMMIAQLVQAKVAMDRLTTFFLLDELQNDAILRRRTKGFSLQLFFYLLDLSFISL